MRRIACTCLMLAALGGVTAGCGSDDETAAAQEQPTPFATPPKAGPEAQAAQTPAPAATVSKSVQRQLADGGIALFDLAGRTLIRPKQVDFSGDVAVEDVTWSRWAPEGAVGTGTATYSDCDPNCLDGEKVRVKATVRLSTPRVCDGRQYFADSRVRTEKGQELTSYLRPPC